MIKLSKKEMNKLSVEEFSNYVEQVDIDELTKEELKDYREITVSKRQEHYKILKDEKRGPILDSDEFQEIDESDHDSFVRLRGHSIMDGILDGVNIINKDFLIHVIDERPENQQLIKQGMIDYLQEILDNAIDQVND